MMNDWRWRISLLLFAAIPACGIRHAVKRYRVMNSVTQLQISEIPAHVTDEPLMVNVMGLPDDLEFFRAGRSEYVIVQQDDNDDPADGVVAVVLRRRIEEDLSLADRVAKGEVKGLVSSRYQFSKEYAVEKGWNVPDSASEWMCVVNVDKDYDPYIAQVTFAYMALGLVALFYVYNKIDESQFKKQLATDKTKVGVAMQMAIAHDDNYRRQVW